VDSLMMPPLFVPVLRPSPLAGPARQPSTVRRRTWRSTRGTGFRVLRRIS